MRAARAADKVTPLDANELQQGQWRSSKQASGFMLADRGHLKALRLLHLPLHSLFDIDT
jgi:hypothetical protein